MSSGRDGNYLSACGVFEYLKLPSDALGADVALFDETAGVDRLDRQTSIAPVAGVKGEGG